MYANIYSLEQTAGRSKYLPLQFTNEGIKCVGGKMFSISEDSNLG